MTDSAVAEIPSNTTLSSKLECKRNMGSRKEKQVDVCSLCFKTFTNRSNYKYHMAHHSAERLWICNECSKSYKTKADLIQHQRVHYKINNLFYCKICSQNFVTRVDYNTHRKSHGIKQTATSGPKKCDICEKMFSDLKSHIQIVHEKIRQHSCLVCGKAFGKKSGLDRHITTVHDKMRRWPCDLCEKRFGEKTLLARHRKIHFKVTCYQNSTADQIHENAEDEEVILIAKKQIRMRCGICRKLLNSRAALKRHKMLVHEKKQNLLCDFCPKLFGEKSNLLRHITKIHAKVNTSLNIAPPEITNENNITSDKIEHYSCTSCDRILITRRGYEAHQEMCRIKQQQKLNTELDQVKEINSDAKCEKTKNCGENQEEIDEDEQKLKEMEQVFLVTQEIETAVLKVEPIFADGNESTNISVKTEPEVSPLVTAIDSFSLKVKDEPKDEHSDIEHLLKSTTLEIEDTEFFQNNSSDYDCKIEDSREGENQTYINDECSDLGHLGASHNTLLTDRSLDNTKASHCKIEECNEKFTFRSQQKHPEIRLPIGENEKHSDGEGDENTVCKSCEPNKVFRSKLSLRRHVKGVHSKHLFICDLCDKTFSIKQVLVRHMQGVHLNIRNFKCYASGCEKKFLNKFELKQHCIGNHNSDKSMQTCNICSKVFKKARYLKMHISSVHGTTNQYTCSICKRSFSFHRSLTRHIQAIHENKKGFQCPSDNCLKEFRSQYEMNEHFTNIHAPDTRKFETCDICEKVLSTRKTLYTHKKMVHEGVRWASKHQCKLCKEIFESKYKKNKHWNQVHRDGKLVTRRCQLCCSDFQLFSEYKAHVDTHVGYFICMTCGAYFQGESSLLIHVESHKTIEEEFRRFVCDICSHRLSTKSQLSIHMRKHFGGDHYVCDVCGKSYKFIAPFLHHKKGHENQLDFPCRYCDKQFRISRDRMLHERSHTGEKPYKCTRCEKRFSQKVIYNNHLKTHEVKGYICKTCGMCFTSELKLRHHVDTEHPEERPFRCCQCSKTFKASKALEAHKEKCGTVRDIECKRL